MAQILIKGVNDLATTDPELVKEWDYEKNGELLPEMFMANSHHQVWWKCKHGHSWQARISTRKLSGCPVCSGRKVLAGYNDFATAHPELLGEWDYEKNGNFLPSMVTPFTVKKVWWRCSYGHEWETSVKSRSIGCGCPVCASVKVLPGYNDLVTTYPEIAKQWDYEKNSLSPTEVTAGSKKRVFWKCEKGHKWQAPVYARVQKQGCPYCTNKKVLVGYNDLATTHPELLKEWDYEKNIVHPTELVAGTRKKVWWKCQTCGYSWLAEVRKRVNENTGCPVCSTPFRVVLTGYNDLATKYPEIAREWNYEKNGDLLPSMVACGASVRVWWKCIDGHEWQTSISNRTSQNTGCPICLKLSRRHKSYNSGRGKRRYWTGEKPIIKPKE